VQIISFRGKKVVPRGDNYFSESAFKIHEERPLADICVEQTTYSIVFPLKITAFFSRFLSTTTELKS
jgi:hypothetical protein